MELKELFKIIDAKGFVNDQNQIINLLINKKNELVIGEDQIQKVQLELDIQKIEVIENKLVPMFSNTNEKGENYEYPSIDLWSKDDFDYLIKRQGQTKNLELKAKYSHILWLSKHKRTSYGLDALSYYISVIKSCEDRIWLDTFDSIPNIYPILFNSFYLEKSLGKNFKNKEVRDLILKILNEFKNDSKNGFLFYHLLELMLANPKTFKADDFVSLENELYSYIKKEESYYKKIDGLDLLIRTANRIGVNSDDYYLELANIYNEQSILREDRANIISVEYCQRAILLYKKLKLDDKVKELEIRSRKYRDSRQLGRIEHEFDITEVINGIKDLSLEILSNKPLDILYFLTNSKMVFISFSKLKMNAENDSFELLPFHTVLYDEKGNTSANISTKDEKLNYSLMSTFHHYLNMYSIRLINSVLIESIKLNIINNENFLSFFKNHTWFGTEISRKNQDEDSIHYNWYSTISPALSDFISQVKFYFINPKNTPNYILMIDSLCLKFEGVIRDICILNDISTINISKDSNDRNLSREKDINTLLRDKELMNVFDEDDLFLFKFIFIDKAGYNLRNRIAHSLIVNENSYGLSYMLMLIMAFLRVGKPEYFKRKI